MIFRRALLTALFLVALAAPAHASIVYDCQTGNICIADDDGSDPSALTKDGKTVNYSHPTLSADGRTLATSSNDGTIVFDMVTRERTVLGGDYAFDLAISPDGKYLADDTGMCDCALHSIVCVYAIANTGQKLCDKQEQAPTHGHVFGPDGRLYTSQGNGTGGTTICRRAAAAATCEATVLTDPSHYLTDFDLSGTRIVAGSATVGQSTGPIFLYDGGKTRQLTSGPTDTAPTFSKDGKKVLFSRGSYPKKAIYAIAVDGKAGSEELLIPDGSEPAVGPTIKVKNPGLDGFSASADGSGVKGKVLIPLGGSELRAVIKGGLGKLVKDDLPAGKRSFTVGLNKKGRKQLHKKGKLTVTLSVTVTPPDGGVPGSESKKIVLKD